MGKVVAILFLVLAIGALVYFVRSGAIKEFSSLGEGFKFGLDFSSSSFKAPRSYGGSGTSSVTATPPAPFPPISSGGTTQVQPQIKNRAPEGFSEADLSPHFGKIRISSAYAGSGISYGRVVLSAGFDIGGRINVSGWELRANRGGQFVPQAISLYDPTGLASEGDIFLGSGEALTLYTTQSAIGKNLRLNKCIGYLENTNKFTPSLPLACPYLGNEPEVSVFTGRCQDYVRSLGSCRLPDADPDVPSGDYACESFLDSINYRGCFERHRGDPDFLSRDWWAWTGRRFLDERHDRILLLDRDGKLVDVYSY